MSIWTWLKTHGIYKSHINYSIAYPKPQNKRALLGYCSHFVSLKPSTNHNLGLTVGELPTMVVNNTCSGQLKKVHRLKHCNSCCYGN